MKNKRGRTEMMSGLREGFKKTYCILPLQCEIKMLHEKPSSTGYLKEGATYSLLTYYFVILPHISNGELITLPFCRKPVFCE